nr:MAG TPA: hypothetical protein [Caudoviricetes sp.]
MSKSKKKPNKLLAISVAKRCSSALSSVAGTKGTPIGDPLRRGAIFKQRLNTI